MQTKGLKGFRDFYPAETAFRNHLFSVWRDVAARYGFEEYDGPPLEPLELYTRKSGEEIVEQLYNFEDKGGREVAFRPEMTPTLARMIAARAQALKKPIRWFSIPQLLRYERPQRGRLREHYQFNMDIIGESGPLADAEVIAGALDIMRALGFGADEIRVRVSDRKVARALLGALGLSEQQVLAAFPCIDKLERETRETLIKQLSRDADVDERLAHRVLAVGEITGIQGVQDALEATSDDGEIAEALTECVQALDAMGLGDFVEVDLSIVRGLAYYQGIVFEVFDVAKSLRAICGGGRYDGLIKLLGGPDLPAVGFAMGDVVIGELLKNRGDTKRNGTRVDAFLVPITMEDLPDVLRLAHGLRDAGVRVEYALKQQSVTKQLKLAASRAAPRAVLIGPDERERGAALVRDLGTGVEEHVPMDQLVNGYKWR